MSKRKNLYIPIKAICKCCGKTGDKTYFNQKYLHEKCKKVRHTLVIRRSITNNKIRKEEETQRYLDSINSCFIKKIRNCRVCGDRFLSSGNHNRACNKCNLVMGSSLVYIVKVYKNPNI